MIPFVDLDKQRQAIADRLDTAISRVLDHGAYILGPEVTELERRLAFDCGAKHAIACSSGTDALLLALMALEAGQGDAVIVPSFTFVATAEAVVLAGATPVFVDVDVDDFCLGAHHIADGVKRAVQDGLRPVGVVTVDLFGQPADYGRINPVAEDNGLWVICDAAQSYGSTLDGRKVGTFGRVTTTSFYPSKPLGCYGDGGAIFTDDTELANVMRSLLVHGAGVDKYNCVRIGLNGRLDTLQAAILLEKLALFDQELVDRGNVASSYEAALSGLKNVTTPVLRNGVSSNWAQYTLRLMGIERDRFRSEMTAQGIPTAVYYPRPLHQQTAFRSYPVADNALPVSESLSSTVVSLPMHAYLTPENIAHITETIRRVVT